MGKADENMSEENYRTALDLYREYRGMNITELANASGVSRQTVGSACKGELKLGEKRLRMLANALCVDPDDLDQDLDPLEVQDKVVNIPAELQRFSDKIARCKPKDIRRKMDNVIAYLDDNDEDVHNVMTYLLTAANSLGKVLTGHLVAKLYPHAYYFKGYRPKIDVGYYAVDESPGEYQAFVLFEDWVYDIFGLENPLQEFEMPSFDGSGTVKQKSLDFAIPIEYHEDGDMDFESELLNQIVDYMWEYEACDIRNPKLVFLFEDLLDDMFSYATIQEYVGEEYDPLLPYKPKKREEKYTQLLYKILQEEGSMDKAVQKTAKILSEINTPEGEEEKVFERYGLNDKV